MAEGPAAGLELLDDLPLERYHLFHAARADLLRRDGRSTRRGPRTSALGARDERAEKVFLAKRIAEL